MAYMQPSEHPDKNKPKKTKTPLTKPTLMGEVKKGYAKGSKGSMVGKYSRGGQNTDLLGGVVGAAKAGYNYLKGD
jgi:hypothetical protein